MAAEMLDMPRQKRNDAITKIDAELLRKARHVANQRDIQLAQYLSDAARAIIERDYRRFIDTEAKAKDD